MTAGTVLKSAAQYGCTDGSERVPAGKVVPLKLGYIGVVNRSQKDIVDQKDMESARDAEERFFSEHPAYSQLSQRGLIGTRYLARRLPPRRPPPPPPPSRTKWTRRVPHPVLIGHAASLTPY